MIALRPDCTFERFVVTEASRAALEQALAFASAQSPRLLLLTGPPGVGKSHLLRSILRGAEGASEGSLVYVTAAELVRDLVAAVPFPAGVVAVDDLHVLRERPVTQREVAATFRRALDRGGRVACAAGCSLSEIPVLAGALAELKEARLIEMERTPAVDIRRVVASLAVSQALDLTSSEIACIAAESRGDIRRAAGCLARQRLEREVRAAGV